MKCPHCGHEKSRVLETRGIRRVRQCGECLKDFSTIETLAAWAGRDRGWIHEEPPIDPLPEGVPLQQQPPRQTKFQKFHPATLDDGLENAEPHLAELLLSWWNESRWSKNKSASWTRKAWLLNINRVLAMPPIKAMALAQRGVEQGWQSLQEDYVSDVSSAPKGMVMPRDSAMQRAIESWNA